MKRALIFCCIWIALLGVKVYAQRQFRKPLKSTSQSILGFSNYNVGLKAGCPWSYMEKTELTETTYDGLYGYLGGIFVERNLGRWSIALEGTFAKKGTKMHNERKYQIGIGLEPGTMKTIYSTAYNVATVRIPVSYYFKGMVKDDIIVPYIFVGPEMDIPIIITPVTSFTQQIEITIDNNNVTHEKPLPGSTRPFKPAVNVSAVAGIGFMTQIRIENSAIIFKFDAAYNRGIWNLAVPTKNGWRWLFESPKNRIFAHDMEVNFSIVYPIKKILHDACYSFDK